MNEGFLRRLTLESLLRSATDRDELSLSYEPPGQPGDRSVPWDGGVPPGGRLEAGEVFLDRISVNISPLQLSQPGFSDRIQQVLEETGLPPACLELEITESLMLNNPDACQSLLQHLKGWG
nr:EAL domain-containing protein [Synechococcus sp. CCY 9618]